MKRYITDEESRKCSVVKEAFSELYDIDEVCVLDAGRYGYVMLGYFNKNIGFELLDCFVDSLSLFEALWTEWLDTKLIEYGENTDEFNKYGLEGAFNIIPKDMKDELLSNKDRFAKAAGITGYKVPNAAFYRG